VGFSHAARALLPLSPADAGLRGRVRHALAALRAEGGTHMEAGLRCSAQLLGPRDAERRSAVILLSDGQPNAGAMTAKALGAIARGLRGELSLSTLGYGADHSDGVLSELAEAGGGAYAYVPAPELCRIELARAVSAQAEVVADGVSLALLPGRGVTIERVLGAPSVGGFGEHGLEVPLHDFLAAERRPVAFALQLAPYLEAGPATLARLVMKQRPATVVEVAVSAEVGDAQGPLDPAVHALRLGCSAKEARTRAVELAEAGQFGEAKAALEQVIDEIRGAPSAANSPRLTEVLEQLLDDVALMQLRPDAATRAAFRRGQGESTRRAPTAMLSSAYANVPTARLIVLEGASRADVPLAPEMVLGRTPDADLQLVSSGVSRRHTRIVASEGAFWVNDLGSSNGTCLNGAMVRCERLRDGDLLQLGPVKLLYREG
jgi:mRNA-degrading endonuclease toxin of MazEF toxin-antitoxin module